MTDKIMTAEQQQYEEIKTKISERNSDIELGRMYVALKQNKAMIDMTLPAVINFNVAKALSELATEVMLTKDVEFCHTAEIILKEFKTLGTARRIMPFLLQGDITLNQIDRLLNQIETLTKAHLFAEVMKQMDTVKHFENIK